LEIIEPSAASPALHAGVQALIVQLSPSTEITPDHLSALIDSPAVRLLVATPAPEMYVGTLSLVLIPLPTGVRARIEDVVVDTGYRGLGIGRALTERAVTLAADAGARDIDLTTRSHRKAAQSLYESLGFERRETAVLRRSLDRPEST
jgi:ribosomal protein S18 acetylase RimI-like enzyme